MENNNKEIHVMEVFECQRSCEIGNNVFVKGDKILLAKVKYEGGMFANCLLFHYPFSKENTPIYNTPIPMFTFCFRSLDEFVEIDL